MQNGMRNNRNRRQKVQVTPRFFIIVGLLLAVVSGFALQRILGGGGDYTVRRGTLGSPQTLDALIVRDEIVVNSKTYGTYAPNAEEGALVSEDDLIATVYDSGYSSDTVRTQLDAVRQQILDYQTSSLLESVNDQSLTQLSQKVSQTVAAWKEFVNGTANQRLYERQAALAGAMEERQGFLRQTIAAGDQALTDLYDKEQKLLDQIANYKTEYRAEQKGRVSFFFDGRETVLTVGKLSQISVADVHVLLQDGKTPSPINARTDKPLYRIASTGVYYLVALFPQKETSLVAGATATISVGEGGPIVTGTIEHIATEANEQIAVYRVDGDIGNLLGVRKVNLLLGERQDGYIVPEAALFGRNAADGTAYIRTEAGQQIGVYVRMTHQAKALVEPMEPGTLVQGTKLARNAGDD